MQEETRRYNLFTVGVILLLAGGLVFIINFEESEKVSKNSRDYEQYSLFYTIGLIVAVIGGILFLIELSSNKTSSYHDPQQQYQYPQKQYYQQQYINCPSCNLQIQRGTQFCPSCGTKILN